MLGDNAFLLEQLGFGHTTLAQPSACTLGAMVSYFANSTVRVVFGVCLLCVRINRFHDFQLPEGPSCPVDNLNLFPALNGSTKGSKRSKFLRRW